MPNPRTPTSRTRLRVGCAIVVVTLAVVAGGCSSDKADQTGSTTDAPAEGAKADLVKRANAVCKSGKARTAKIVPGSSVVPKPTTGAERAATKQWADATAAAVDKTADELEAIDASGDPGAQLTRLVASYREAADTLRSKGGAVLGQKNFLSDQELFDYGFGTCVAPLKRASTATTTSTTKPTKSTTTKP